MGAVLVMARVIYIYIVIHIKRYLCVDPSSFLLKEIIVVEVIDVQVG